jgi:hypothetical protein
MIQFEIADSHDTYLKSFFSKFKKLKVVLE